ncbi:hypothetical protein JCM14076_14310 [Methylosoma difficile]
MTTINANKPKPADNKKDIICHCSGTTEQQIIAYIESGCDSVDKLSRMTGATTGCGACENKVQEILEGYLRKSE